MNVVLSSADVAFHGGRQTGDRPEGDAQHNQVMWDHGVLTQPTGLSSFCYRDSDFFFFFY